MWQPCDQSTWTQTFLKFSLDMKEQTCPLDHLWHQISIWGMRKDRNRKISMQVVLQKLLFAWISACSVNLSKTCWHTARTYRQKNHQIIQYYSTVNAGPNSTGASISHPRVSLRTFSLVAHYVDSQLLNWLANINLMGAAVRILIYY